MFELLLDDAVLVDGLKSTFQNFSKIVYGPQGERYVGTVVKDGVVYVAVGSKGAPSSSSVTFNKAAVADKFMTESEVVSASGGKVLKQFAGDVVRQMRQRCNPAGGRL